MQYKQIALSHLCSFRNEKTEVNSLSRDRYVSTENMLSEKRGVEWTSSLPSVAVTSTYRQDDVLVSNIRPYFKKIWKATCSGGCSNDVLVFTPHEGVNPTFLYYVLSQDDFFAYATKTAKGTKMPRGDKKAIMDFIVPLIPLEPQRKIAAVLSSLDDKIETNNAICRNLEELADVLFADRFVNFGDFEGRIPDAWQLVPLSRIADVTSGKRPPMKQTVASAEVSVPLLGASAIMGYTNRILYDSRMLVIGRVGTHGVVQRVDYPCWPSDNTLVVSSSYYEFVYQSLKRIDYRALNRGSTQPLITQSDVLKEQILLPDSHSLNEYEACAGALMQMRDELKRQNSHLAALRDTLLPRLMSGELDVSAVKL